MKKITKNELDKILRKHKLWLMNDPEGEMANLSEANLYRVDLSGASLYRTNLSWAKNINYPIACPEKGSFIAFKKASGGFIVELEIPEDAKRCSATTRKCRCSKARVVSITNPDGTETEVTSVASKRDAGFVYKVGEVVEVPNFDEIVGTNARQVFISSLRGKRPSIIKRRNVYELPGTIQERWTSGMSYLWDGFWKTHS